MLRLGVIGYGSRIRDILHRLACFKAGTVLAAITDVRNDEIRQKHAEEVKNAACYTDAEEMLAREKLDGVLIGTRCHLHTPMAIKVAPTGLPLFLEKPVAPNMTDLVALAEAFAKSSCPVVVSFPLRLTLFVQKVKQILAEGKIGEIHHVQALNNVTYGGVYYHDWYRDENETQGLWIQKATHDFDYLNYVLEQKPRLVCAMMSKRVFKGQMPAGLKCAACPRQDCPEHPYYRFRLRYETREITDEGRQCAFAVDTGNEDMGSAIIEYENGAQAVYTQNFFVRRGAGARGARFIGYEGTVEFDWKKGELTLIAHHKPLVETVRYDRELSGHGGGDTELVDNFLKVMRGEETSRSPLKAGITSVAMCLAAKESCLTRRFVEVRDLAARLPG